MATYLDADTVKRSVDRLAEASALPRLCDYLIFKRALVLSGGYGAEVVTGTKSEHFQQAIAEWTEVDPDASEHRFFNPIGAARDQTGGYRTLKFASNGPSDTVSRWQSALEFPPFVLVKGTSPKAYTFSARPYAELRRDFIGGGSSERELEHLPSLLDLSVWWLRGRDVEKISSSAPVEEADLIRVLIADNLLNGDELLAFFGEGGDAGASAGNDEILEES